MEEKLRELEAKATPGPWKLWNGWGPHTDSLMRVERIGPDGDGGIQPSNGGDMMGRREDLEIVCQMRNALPALLARLAALTRERDELAAGNPNIQSHFALLKEIEANRVRFVEVLAERDAERARAEKARGEAVAVVETFLHHQRKLMADSATNETRDQAYHAVVVLSAIMDKLRALAHDEGRGT